MITPHPYPLLKEERETGLNTLLKEERETGLNTLLKEERELRWNTLLKEESNQGKMLPLREKHLLIFLSSYKGKDESRPAHRGGMKVRVTIEPKENL